MSTRQRKWETRRRRKEEDLKNASMFFISNLLDSCDTVRLWEASKIILNLRDAFVQEKRDGSRNRFGFIRMKHIVRTKDWILESVQG
ncbi:hypothetical protein Hanom_Chr11g01052121 [Helianthus anomalus]